MRIQLLGLLLTLSCVAGSGAWAGQKVILSCGGDYNQYDPETRIAKVSAGATSIDLEQRSIETPVGIFRITRQADDQITFDDPKNSLVVFGRLDRISGQMTIFWRRPEEEAKLQRGQTAKTSSYAELQCRAARPLF